MKRISILLALILIVAVSAWAHDAVLKINPSDMKDGERKVLEDDGRTITLEKKGNTTIVTIDGDTESLTITRDGDRLRIGPDRKRIVINGMDLGDLGDLPALKNLPRFHPRSDTWFVCPKDKTIVRIPEAKTDAGATYKCPVDGTTLEKRKGRGFMFMFDDEVIGL